MLFYRMSILMNLLRVRGWGSILQLHLDVRERTKPKLPLRQGARGEVMILEAEAGAVDAHLFAAHAFLSHWYLHQGTRTLLIRVQHELRVVIEVCVKLAVEQRRRVHVLGREVEQIAGHEPPMRHRCRVNRVAPYAKVREQALRDEPYSMAYVQHPPRALLIAFQAEVEAGPLGEQGHLEDLELLERAVLALELAIPHQREWVQRDALLGAEALGVHVRTAEREAVDVEGEVHFLDLILRGDVPHGAFPYRDPTKSLARAHGVGHLLLARRWVEGELLFELEAVSRKRAAMLSPYSTAYTFTQRSDRFHLPPAPERETKGISVVSAKARKNKTIIPSGKSGQSSSNIYYISVFFYMM